MEIIFLKKMWDYWGDKYKYVMYENIRNKVNKLPEKEVIPKYEAPWGSGIVPIDYAQLLHRNNIKRLNKLAGINPSNIQNVDFGDEEREDGTALTDPSWNQFEHQVEVDTINNSDDIARMQKANSTAVADDPIISREVAKIDKENATEAKATGIANMFGVDSKWIGDGKGLMSAKGAAATGIISQVGVRAMKAVDLLAMGDKNFGALSQAIDSAVHSTSSALMLSGNPYAMAAGAALEGANFLTKAGGLTVQGFDANINSSGYGTLGHMESSSSRSIFGFNSSVEDKLARRNEQARMALTAASIANDQSFEQEARMNSVENTIMNNQIALAGGLDTNMIAG